MIDKILSLDKDARVKSQKYECRRFIYDDLKQLFDKDLFIGLAGLRGSGKTVLLLQLANNFEDSLYISLDSIDEKIDLYDIIKELNQKYGIKYFFLDEIHNYSKWEQELKKIYDFLDVKIMFTSSVSIGIIESKYDLARRVSVIRIEPFSFREYLYFRGINLNSIKFEDLFENNSKLLKYETYYDEYVQGGCIPASLNSPPGIIIPNVIDKIVSRDLVAIKKLNLEDINSIKIILKFISTSPVDVVGFRSISSNTGITIYKVQQYIEILEKAFLLNVIYPKSRNVMQEPKILFRLSFRYYLSNNSKSTDVIGAQREEFFIDHTLRFNPKYIKDKRGRKMPDYYLELEGKSYIFEIGGRSKTNKQLKERDKKIKRYIVQEPLGYKNNISLILFGFL